MYSPSASSCSGFSNRMHITSSRLGILRSSTYQRPSMQSSIETYGLLSKRYSEIVVYDYWSNFAIQMLAENPEDRPSMAMLRTSSYFANRGLELSGLDKGSYWRKS